MVQRARELHEGGNALTKLQMEIVCPELTESEDERIRKEIIEYIKSGEQRKCYNKRWISYLEKQKEQKPAERTEDSVKFEEGFKAGRESGLRDGQKYVLDNLDSYGLCKHVEWSEEDRKMLNTIISDGSRGVEFDAKQVNFLKSLCPQYHWKPSEEQMVALGRASTNEYLSAKQYDILVSLYEQLKTL